MPRPKLSVPTYRHHKASGQAVCFVNRRTVYLGPWNSPESKREYSRVLTELQAEQQASPAPSSGPAVRSVGELLLKYNNEHLPRYAKAEQDCQRGVIRIVRELFAETPANDFGPLRLRAVRDAMLQGRPANPADPKDKGRKPWSVSFINKQVKRLRYIFRMGISWEYVSQSVADALGSVPALESSGGQKRKAIPQANLDKVREQLTKQLHRDLFDLMLLTGARSGELLMLTGNDFDRTGDVWRVELKRHKTTHFGKDRVLFFNAKAQLILRRYLTADGAGRLFKIRREHFGRVVKKASAAAGVATFSPHSLRHTVATQIVDAMGTEAAQRLLGHSDAAMTEHYSKAAEKLARKAAKRLG